MLLLLFHLGRYRYAIDVQHVVEVLPLVAITEIPQAPEGVAGVFSYRGAPVPAVDVSWLALGRPAARRLSTRIVVVRYPGSGSETHALGLIAERATETIRRDPGDFKPSGLTCEGAPYLGRVALDAAGAALQWVDIPTLLSPVVRKALFAGSE